MSKIYKIIFYDSKFLKFYSYKLQNGNFRKCLKISWFLKMFIEGLD